MKCIFYFKDVNSIGGVESFIYYLSKKYDFEFYYKKGDPLQIQRIAENIKVKKYNGEKLICDKFFINYNPDIIDNVEAKEYIMMIHCDYSAVKFKPITHPKFTKYIGVSKYVCDVFTKLTRIKAEVCYNPVFIEYKKVKKKKDKIHLISATRLSSEKGGWRIDKLSEILDEFGLDYDWTIYTNKKPRFKSSNIILKEPKLDLSKEIAESTYLVQLSDAEAFCYSVVEALKLGTPVIVTDLPVYKELGLNDSNSIILDLFLKNVDVKKIKKNPICIYEPPKENWGKYLSIDKEYNPNELVEITVLKNKLWLVKENIHLKKNDKYKVSRSRASFLESKGFIEWN